MAQSANHLFDNAIRMFPRHHYTQGQWRQETAEVVVEEALTLFVNGQEFVTMVITPTDIQELVIGFLAAEGFIKDAAEVTVFQYHAEDGQVWVRIPGLKPERLNQFGKRYLSGCCGRGRPGFYFTDDVNLEALRIRTFPYSLDADRIRELFEILSHHTQQQHSGGLHAAGLADCRQMLAVRFDVGRHNALDKLYGYTLLHHISREDKVIVFSGRLSAEVIIKTGRMGVPVVISNAAPTTMGLDLADQLGITVIGFVRNNEMSVYTHKERLSPVSAQ
ncbi:MAG: formate dehydrogenase accessory sulfurtransferase FdhD [Firmicutes bacterium]|jgi:FdhD protein|uniref:Sulfur carrier protein FdhD n=1 Tax=Sulfobacillus benefaciens TaxID=453960 RepID=A0A2T2X7E4_9FIRM|nr:formate dehydrogenase accessory sulfurtransferase FdhD [Bacillota bacterium]MCL5013633.1 formate dehydrogenase accessory sulfurtransferase FdhD [Bacillota bacterium]PSR30423.1 MAG: formate dehydrogenase accessory sulfurtransferase FdhD [Sulfobacillus benefaciens]